MADENLFLRHLAPAHRDWLKPHLQRIALRTGEVVAHEGRRVETALLPIDCILSVITVMRDGRLVESRTIGREGGFGFLHAIGAPYAFERVEIQVSGHAWTLPPRIVAELAARDAEALRTIISFAQATLLQSAASLACNALHPVEQRLCRWLLMTQDRLGSDVVPLTQEHLGIMLAVQRTTVTAAAARLQREGMIQYVRGRITITDRKRLIAASCECYEQIEDAVARTVGERIEPDRRSAATS
jgi:CRP-like cAMP-binding protein